MFATNNKNGFLGGYGSSLGDLVLGLPPSYDRYIRSHASLVNYWPLYSHTASATVTREVVGGITGTYHGTPTDGTQPIGEGCVVFGSGARMTTGAIGISRGTVEFWVKISSNPVTGANKGLMFGLVDSSSAYDKIVYLNANGTVSFAIQEVTTNTIRTITTPTSSPLIVGRWNHIVCVQESTAGLTIYLNGVSVVTAAFTNASRTNLTTGGWLSGTGATLGFVDVPGTYCNLALYSGTTTLTAANVANHYAIASKYFTSVNVRMTQEVVEVIRNAATVNARLTQEMVEVLRSSLSGSIFNVSASNQITLDPECTGSRIAFASASNQITFSSYSAANGFVFTTSCQNVITFSPVASGHKLATSVASSQLTLSAFATKIVTGNKTVAGISGITFTAISSQVRDIEAFAATTFNLGDNYYGSVLFPVSDSVSTVTLLATSSLRLIPASVYGVSGVVLSASASCSVFRGINVSAGSRIRFSSVGYVNASKLITAFSTNTLRLSSLSSEVADFATYGSSTFSMSGSSKSGRDIYVYAMTEINLSITEKSNEHFYMGSVSDLMIDSDSSCYISGTLAESRFKITILASARVQFPWRFQPLTLPPGGGLPHS